MNAKQSVEFCSDLIRQAKETLVSEEGIGSDVAPCVIAFDQDDQCIGWAQMTESVSDRLDQYQRLALVAGMMRAGWHANAIVFAIEGYLLIGNSETDEEVSLAKQFADGNKNVHECISIVYGNDSGSIMAMSIPYKQEIGRKVTWLDGSTQVTDNAIEGIFVEVIRDLFDVVEMIPWPPDGDMTSCMKVMASYMSSHGFMLVWGNPGGDSSDWEIPEEWIL